MIMVIVMILFININSNNSFDSNFFGLLFKTKFVCIGAGRR